MNSLKWFVFKGARLATLLFAVCLISFLLMKNAPIDPIQAYVGADLMHVSPEQRLQIEQNWGLDESWPVQFGSWVQSLASGNLGSSMIYRQPVSTVIAERFIPSIALMAVAWVLSGTVGFVLGIVAAMKQGYFTDRLIKGYCYTLASTPTFWMGMLLLIIFSVWLGWFPVGMGVPAGVLAEQVSFAHRVHHLVLPAVALSIIGVANVALHTRQKLIDVLQSDFALFARARGMDEWTLVRRHGLRNVAMPAITLQFASFGELFGGAVLAEQVFSYPGLGEAMVEAGLRGDIPLLLGLVLFSALFVFLGNTIADVIHHWVDPRIQKGATM